MDVDVHFAEVPLHRFPGAARGDAHDLVVVAGRAAGGEGVAQPIVVLDRNRVGNVGEGRGALVGGDHQIGVVTLVAHHAVGRNDAAVVVDVVGDVEQRRYEQLVGFDAFRLHHVAGGALRHQLGHEAALGADRHDHRVLDLLRLNQPEDLGAEILRPVRPADAAARHLAEAHVHAFDTRRIDENFVERARQRQIGDLAAFELDRDQRLGMAGLVGLKEIGANRRLHRIYEVTQDAVLVQALDLLQFHFDARGDLALPGVAPGRRLGPRIEPGMEQFDDVASDGEMLGERRPHVVLRIGHAYLAQEARQRADQRHVAPGQVARERQRVVAVVLGSPAHHHQEGGLQTRLAGIEIDHAAVAPLQQHVVKPGVVGTVAIRRDVIGALVDYPESHVFQHRNALRQRQRARQTPDFEADRALLLLQPVMEIHPQRALLAQRFDHADIAGCHRRRIGFLEADGKCIAVTGKQRVRLVRRIGQRQRVAQTVGP